MRFENPPIPIDHANLRRLVGSTVHHKGEQWLVIDYHDDGPALVLEHCNKSTIQADQHGHGKRRTPITVSVPLFDADGELHPAFSQLALGTVK